MTIECNNASCRECHPPAVSCDKCHALIPYMESGHGNLDGGMRVYFQGWYGATIDPFYEPKVVLCDACAVAFLSENPWLGEYDRELISPASARTSD